MGATGWSYFIKYDKDPAVALKQLQLRVFKRGEFGTSDLMKSIYQQAADGFSDEEIVKQARLFGIAKKFQKFTKTGTMTDSSLVPDFNVEVTDKLIAEYRRAQRSAIKRMTAPPSKKYKSIQDLKDDYAESGTHSILDIVGVATKPNLFTACELSTTKTIEIFGTERPTKAEIESKTMPLQHIVQAQHAWYLPVWRGSRKTHYYFEGASGD